MFLARCISPSRYSGVTRFLIHLHVASTHVCAIESNSVQVAIDLVTPDLVATADNCKQTIIYGKRWFRNLETIS